MWKPAVVLAMLAVPSLSSVAHADRPPRSTALSVSGGVAVMGPFLDAENAPNRLGSLVSASLAWDRPAPEYPAYGTAVGHGDLVPEVTLFSYGNRGGALAGLRLEGDFAERGMGVFRVSARMSAWLAPRIGVIQGAGGLISGGDFGEVFYLGHSDWRIGFSMGMLTWHEAGAVDTPLAGTIAFRAEAPGSRQLAVTLALVVGH